MALDPASIASPHRLEWPCYLTSSSPEKFLPLHTPGRLRVMRDIQQSLGGPQILTLVGQRKPVMSHGSRSVGRQRTTTTRPGQDCACR